MCDDLDGLSPSRSIVCRPEDCRLNLPPLGNCLSIITQNIRSISCNFENFQTLMSRIDVEVDLIILTECWLSCCSNIPVIDGYKYSCTENNFNQNDGLVIYFKENLKCTSTEIKLLEANCILTIINNNIALISIYRPAAFKNTDNFTSSLNELLQSLSSYKDIIIVGDININIIDNSHSSRYLDVTAFHGLLPAHQYPTRLSSCLDHVLVKSNLESFTLVMPSSITDHGAVLFSIDTKTNNSLPRAASTYTKVDHDGLQRSINRIDFGTVFDCNNADTAAEVFVNILKKAIDTNSKTCLIPNKKRIIKAWITPGLLRCMRHRDRLHMDAKRDSENLILKVTYTRYRNYCNKLLKKLKRIHDQEEVTKAGKDSKKIWTTLKNIANINVKKEISNDLLTSYATPRESVNGANKYFADIGKTLAEKIPIRSEPMDFSKFGAKMSYPNSFVLLEPDESEIETLIMTLRKNCAVGCDSLSTDFIKTYKNIIVPPLTYLCKLCLVSGVFPKIFKKALVTPIYKSGDRGCVGNYRPISVLPVLSKILERLINNRLVTYLNANNLLSDQQYGFRSGRSTSDAVHELVDHVVKNMDKGEKVLSIFLDLAKAFDTVSVPLLLCKLENIGVRGIQLKLFKDYLSDRYQRVKIGNFQSDDLPLTFGVPQGSILGPTLFLVYIDDLSRLKLPGCKIVSYADDTAVCFSSRSWRDTFNLAQYGFDIINRWLNVNTLTLNTDKTKFIAYSITNRTRPSPSFKIIAHTFCNNPNGPNCRCLPLKSTTTMKYLGILLDKNLCFKDHVNMLVGRVRKLIYVFKTLRHVLKPNILKTVYYALCQSIIMYCITVWGGTCKTTLLPLERAQRAVLKVSTFRPYRFPTAQLFKFCEVLSVRQLFIFHTILLKHRETAYDPSLNRGRRGFKCHFPDFFCPKTSFSQKFYPFLGTFLYNKINVADAIYPLTINECKIKLKVVLSTYNYEQSENLLVTIK